MITIELIKLYEKYAADQDGVIRVGSQAEQKLLNDGNDWTNLSIAYQDIELISKKLYSNDLAIKALVDLKYTCDSTSYNELTSLIPFYLDFQKVADLVAIIKSHIDSGLIFIDDRLLYQLTTEIEDRIRLLKFCDFESLTKIKLYFLPSSKYYEFAILGKWENEFLMIGKHLNNVYEDIYKKIAPGSFKSFRLEANQTTNIFYKMLIWISKFGNIFKKRAII